MAIRAPDGANKYLPRESYSIALQGDHSPRCCFHSLFKYCAVLIKMTFSFIDRSYHQNQNIKWLLAARFFPFFGQYSFSILFVTERDGGLLLLLEKKTIFFTQQTANYEILKIMKM